MTKLKNILIKHFQSEWRLVTKWQKPTRTETCELCFNLLVNIEYLEKELGIRIQIDDKEGEAADHGNLGTLYLPVGEHDMAEVFFLRRNC